MNSSNPTMSDLFGQLGLANDEQSIDRFCEQNQGLSDQVRLEHAPFWNSAQASFLASAWDEDAEWAELIDQLNARLR